MEPKPQCKLRPNCSFSRYVLAVPQDLGLNPWGMNTEGSLPRTKSENRSLATSAEVRLGDGIRV